MADDDAPTGERILRSVLELLDEGGADAVSTRAVTARAAVQAPALYRLFGDKDGLLLAACERAYADWVGSKARRSPHEDPVEALRDGWDDAVDFGTRHPAVYRLAEGRSDRLPSLAAGQVILGDKMARLAAAGRLRVSVEQATLLFHAAGRGVILTLIDGSMDTAGLALSDLAREAAIAAIVTDAPLAGDATGAASAGALRAVLSADPDLSAHARLIPAEVQLLDVWLQRIAAPPLPPLRVGS